MPDKEYKDSFELFTKLKKSNEEKIQLGINDYSLINSLLRIDNEDELHSNFIFSMINPKGMHYKNNIFLKLFLESINEKSFLDIENCKVYKEKGKIDLLLTDGNCVIIIENKFRAIDQKYQISRYISYAIENYLNGDLDSLDKKIRIVYLSEYKKEPSKESKSIEGFSLEGSNLIWNNEKIDIKDTLKLDLKSVTLKFNRVQHSLHLKNWTIKSLNWLSENEGCSNNLSYAFKEYREILKRLKINNQWRKVMNLDKYMLELGEKEEKKMYEFMCESRNNFYSYSGKKLFKEITNLFESKSIKMLKVFKYQKFTEDNSVNWYKKNGKRDKWKNIGFYFEYNRHLVGKLKKLNFLSSPTILTMQDFQYQWVEFNEKYIFVLGEEHAYFAKDDTELIASENRISDIRKINIFTCLDIIAKKLEKIIKE